MSFCKPVTALICVAGAGLLAAGCSSSTSATSSSTSATSATTPATPASSGTSASASVSAQAAGSPAACQVGVLSVALGAKTGGTNQPTQVVDLTNKGSSACTMDGFAGVDLVGAANGKQDYSWPLERSSASYSRVTLQPGASAHFGLVYLPAAAGDSSDITVAKIMLTPPNTFSHTELTWSQKVLLQDGATHPGTYITPVTTGS